MQKGFTLIELIITISIIGILGTILYPNFTKIQTKAKISSLATITHTLQLAVETFYLNNGIYPKGENIAIKDLTASLIQNQVLSKTPKNPFTGTEYTNTDTSGKILYSYSDTTQSYQISAWGPGNKDLIITLENI